MPRARARGAALGEAECAAAAPGSGGEPPPGALRALKRLARGSPAGARAAYAGLMGRLREDDCRVRVHALEAAHALAMRSKLFRDLLARDFCGFLDLTAGSRNATVDFTPRSPWGTGSSRAGCASNRESS